MAKQQSSSHFERIPQPPEKFLIGNLLDIRATDAVQDLIHLAQEYGPIFQLSLPGRQLVVVSGFDLVNELCDESRFDKKVWTPLQIGRAIGGDGLFTSWTHEPNWHKAHNILLPNFSLKAMQNYLPMMVEIAEQLIEKWGRMNASDEIDVNADMTRLTLDTISLCGFDYRFNSFYRETPHPFVQSMTRALEEALERTQRLPIQDTLMLQQHRQFQADVDFMNDTVDRIIKDRKERGEQAAGKSDLLSCMLTGVDKRTGEMLDDINIRYQIITFLVAGHETTSSLLSFALYFLLRHPTVLAKAYAEVDRVLGPDPTVRPTFAHVHQLQYVSQVLKESLRFWPTAPLFALYPIKGEAIIGGKYKVTKEQDVAVLIPMLHRDKTVWGEDADIFNPEHFSPEAEQVRPPNAFKPFGNGQRACLGRQFAMQEAALALGMILQSFQLIDQRNYELKIKEMLTLKPDSFKIQIKPRTTSGRSVLVSPTLPGTHPPEVTPEPTIAIPAKQHHTPLLVLYGSNLGTAEDIAQRIAEDGRARGFTTAAIPLDDRVNQLPKDGAVVIVTASYNGTSPDNAIKFCAWLKGSELAADALKGVSYTVFGCGNREWAATFQAIPRLVDSALEQHGAKRIYQKGEGDASGDFDSTFQAWYQPLWNALAGALSIDLGESTTATPGYLYQVELISEAVAPNLFVASFGAQPMRLLSHRELHRKDGPHPSERSAQHIEVALPAGVTYHTGEHLGVLARNNKTQVKRVAAHFHFDKQSKIRLHKNDTRKTNFPIDEPVRVFDLLSEYVELQDAATRTQLKALVEHTECPPEKAKLIELSGDDDACMALYRQEILEKRKSLIDLLEEFPSCTLPFSIYLELLSPLRPRYYSISSSPALEKDRCSITVGVVQGPAKSGHGTFEGVCSTCLSRLEQDDSIYAFVQDTKSHFMPPENPSTPMIMIGPGTGFAPFRGFLQDRVALKSQGKTIGKSLLFFGCRHPQQDFIYEDELKAFADQGITELSVAFSRLDGQQTYVQDKIKEDKEKVWQLIQDGATIYICGDASKMAPDVRKAFASIYQEKTHKSEQEANHWLDELTAENRYLVDVWGTS